MDITSLFKACVKTARLKNKSLAPAAQEKSKTVLQVSFELFQICLSPLNSSSPFQLKHKIPNGFSNKTRTICQQLTQLRDCLLENRSAYMKFGCHLKGVAQKMTDQERDVIDVETDKILGLCTQLIIELRQEVKREKPKQQQNAEYMDNVLESLTSYLKNVFGISNQMRTYRVKKELETYRLLKLKADKRDIPETPKLAKQRIRGKLASNGGEGGLRRRRKHQSKKQIDDSDREDLLGNWNDDGDWGNNDQEDEEEDQQQEDDDDDDDNYDSGTDTGDFISEDRALLLAAASAADKGSTMRRSIPSKLALDEEIAVDQSSYILDEEEQQGSHGLSPEDVQMFELENKQLLSELKGLSEEISQIEKNVTEIAKLQDLFTEKAS